MISQRTYLIVVAVLAVVLVAGAAWTWPVLRGLWPAIGPATSFPESSASVSPAQSGKSEGPLSAADGWTYTLVTRDVPGARDIAIDPLGNLWVSQPSEGTVSLVELQNGDPIVQTIFRDMDRPHGLAFDPEDPFSLYIAEQERIVRGRTYSEGGIEHIADLPSGGRHWTRTLAFGPQGRLYVSIGSSCDVCYEANPEHGSIISMEKDGSDRRLEATGLRNAVFTVFHPGFPESLWVTEMGRDRLGDDLPPDEINVIDTSGEVADYGWPLCYGDRVHDTEFDTNTYIQDPCVDTLPPVISLPAHSAPLGLAFLSASPSGTPDGSVLVAYHGSWNRTVPTGYEVVRWEWDGVVWSSSPFLTGFLTEEGSSLGRPVDVLSAPDGTVYISDDKAGAIWKMERQP